MKEVYEHRYQNIEEKKQFKIQEQDKKEEERRILIEKQRKWEDEETAQFFTELEKIKKYRDLIADQIKERFLEKKKELDL